MNPNVAVSIIVPVYNVENFLARCLNSLSGQTLKNIEIICINDGSTDSSQKILEKYKHKDNRIIIINQTNSGQSSARNKGIEIAKGKYIGFVDSDDWVDLDFFEKLYNAAEKNQADIAVAGIFRLHKYNKKIHLKIKKEECITEINKKFLVCDCPEKSYVWNKIYNTEKLKENALNFEEGIIFEDVIFTPQALYKLNKLVTVPNTYYYYWRRKKSTVTNKSKKAKKDYEYTHKIANEFFKKNNIDISIQEVKTYRFKIFGITIYKKQTKNSKTKHILFNIFKFGNL